jgi:hypothetical protein
MKGRERCHHASVFPPELRDEIFLHELGNVLNGLQGAAERLRCASPDPEFDRWLRAIEHSGRQITRLADAFLGDASRQWPSPAASDAHDGIELVEQLLIAQSPAAVAGGHCLVLVAGTDVPRRWRCDPCAVRQLLDNLVGNAIRYSTGSEVLVELRRAAEPGGALEIRVSDHGMGVSDGEGLFEPYVSNLHQGAGSGASGLGLYVCDRLARSMGGRIRWRRRKGGGSRFAVLLPGVLPDRASRQASAEFGIFRQVRCRIGLSGSLRRSVCGFLDRMGVRWEEERSESHYDPNELVVLIRQAGQGVLSLEGGYPQPGGPGTSAGDAGGHAVRLLAPPVLESGLGSALLECWLSSGSRFRTGGKPG